MTTREIRAQGGDGSSDEGELLDDAVDGSLNHMRRHVEADQVASVGGSDFPRPGDVLGLKYEVERVVAAGGRCVTFIGYHLCLGQRVAIAVLRPEAWSFHGDVARFPSVGELARALRPVASPGGGALVERIMRASARSDSPSLSGPMRSLVHVGSAPAQGFLSQPMVAPPLASAGMAPWAVLATSVVSAAVCATIIGLILRPPGLTSAPGALASPVLGAAAALPVPSVAAAQPRRAHVAAICSNPEGANQVTAAQDRVEPDRALVHEQPVAASVAPAASGAVALSRAGSAFGASPVADGANAAKRAREGAPAPESATRKIARALSNASAPNAGSGSSAANQATERQPLQLEPLVSAGDPKTSLGLELFNDTR